MSIYSDIIREILSDPKCADLPTRTVASIAFGKYPNIFTNAEGARAAVRWVRGERKGGDGHITNNKTFFRDEQQRKDAMRHMAVALPRGKTTLAEWNALVIEEKKVLSLSDIHIPYHVDAAVELAVRSGKRFAPDVVLLNGDLADFYSISRYETDPRKRNLREEVATVRAFLEWLREMFPKARIIFKLGNHDERWQSYMRLRGPDLCGMQEFTIENILHLSDYGIELLGDKRAAKIGQLYIVHGHEWKKTFSAPVNAARGIFLRAKACCLAGHWHQPSTHIENDVGHRMISTWCQGCLCELHPEYAAYNNWAHGWATIERTGTDGFHLENWKIVNGKPYPS